MTGTGTLMAERLRVHVNASDPIVRDAVVAKLRHAGIAPVGEPGRAHGAVLVAAGGTVDEAIDACLPGLWSDGRRLLVVADVLSHRGVLRAVQAGARAMLHSAGATPARLAAAVHSAHQDEGRLPHSVLARLLNGLAVDGLALNNPVRNRSELSRSELTSSAVTGPPHPGAEPGPGPTTSRLTSRQTEVLTLMAEGHGNAAIARSLACSEHTVKNVIYELMARLQVRNRAHAVAHAVRAGLI
ncbi:response regulator transcription factor [Streptomyces sp. NPDC058657]|uniref:helix-turn-helix transcriptional regulator n=1 Tax=unclassified Streptomyces TaxID=2593676 RepID=UPI003668DE07